MNASLRYTRVARALHWTIAVVIILMFVGGKFMTHLPLGVDLKYIAFQNHKTLGLIVLVLSFVRLWWRLGHPPPPLPDKMARWEREVARITHIVFYGFMIGVPLLGWAMVSADPAGIPTKLFFLIPIPDLPVPEGAGIRAILQNAHGAMATAMIALVVLHVGAALKHHYVSQDGTLLRMLTGRSEVTGRRAVPALTAGLVGVALTYLTVMLVWGNEDDAVTLPPQQDAEMGSGAGPRAGEARGPHAWRVDMAASHVRVAATAYGDEYQAEIPGVYAEIRLDPADPGAVGTIRARLDMTSLEGGSRSVTSELVKPKWFDIEHYPEARFVSETVRSLPSGDYEAEGVLTVKDQSVPLTLPFTLSIEGDRAVAIADVTLNRLDLGLGAPGGGIAEEVAITVHLEADRAN
ncbi:hypothetical protein PB2503_09874 [Parvularcula bermudensis HTCC2503]|uniref:Lipid/polyisoprenoid-binding YceI-like domain-containing protein n=1 Tax=Parvularcula bermudensis (strain ATCC BAA-594 / HTCC2503 / KCTC 12087) TaxID=314260 RepID=E0TEE1_PARBH|nr:cytochrome b/b6 domain-containing protein [Parvularcula bermudensis]ADM10027.1 hypothetical protein PB2503_09874 [Parvularcula bermudensis HTCC2503]